MHRYIGLLVTLSIAVLLGSGLSAQQALSEPKPDGPKPSSNDAAFAPGRILVKVEEGAPADALVPLNRRNDARVEEKLPDARVSVVDLPEDLSVAEAVERYEASPDVEYAEPDYLLHLEAMPNDPNFPKMYDLNNTRQYGGTLDADVDAPEAWNANKGSAGTVVAVIDTGMDINHPDLNDNIWVNPDERPGNGRDDDHNDYVDDVNGWDFRNRDNSVFDGARQDTHATHVAGTIAAEGNNGIGVTGVNWQAEVVPLKFIGADGWGYGSDFIEALDYAVDEGIKISNNSWGGYGYSQAIRDAIGRADAAGHLVVAAAGNGGEDFVGDNNDSRPLYPASYDSPNVISVAASDYHDNLTPFSNYGTTSVDLAAPGLWVYSTLPGNTYGYGDGTSMATPHVTGAAALLKSTFPELDAVGIKTRILGSVDRRQKLNGRVASGGRLNAARALGVAVPPPPSTAPEIASLRPKKTRDRTPAIRAKVWDAQTNLVKTNIKVYFHGRKVAFSYAGSTDTLTFRPKNKLSYSRHNLKIVAWDPQGLDKVRSWSFRVIRR